ncbi:AAA family ATPase [Comamonas guangdongensis]
MDASPRAPAAASTTTGTLHLMCGKIASGKSTLARQLAQSPHTILISEDGWLAQLYPEELQSVADYVRLSARLRLAVAAHIVSVLRAGSSVVLDFPANTVQTRAWARSIFEQAEAAHVLHHLDFSNEICRSRLQARNRSAEHQFQATDAQFGAITRYFVPPSPEEGFNLVEHR